MQHKRVKLVVDAMARVCDRKAELWRRTHGQDEVVAMHEAKARALRSLLARQQAMSEVLTRCVRVLNLEDITKQDRIEVIADARALLDEDGTR